MVKSKIVCLVKQRNQNLLLCVVNTRRLRLGDFIRPIWGQVLLKNWSQIPVYSLYDRLRDKEVSLILSAASRLKQKLAVCRPSGDQITAGLPSPVAKMENVVRHTLVWGASSLTRWFTPGSAVDPKFFLHQPEYPRTLKPHVCDSWWPLWWAHCTTQGNAFTFPIWQRHCPACSAPAVISSGCGFRK